MTKSKISQIDSLIDGTSHFGRNPLEIYQAARSVRNGLLRVGVERQVAAAKKALKAFNIIVSVAFDSEGRRGVRLYAPEKHQELKFFDSTTKRQA